MSQDNDGACWPCLVWTAVYLFVSVLTAGHSWHSTCSDINERFGRWMCSAGLGIIWPVTLSTKFGIWFMDPDMRWPSVRFDG